MPRTRRGLMRVRQAHGIVRHAIPASNGRAKDSAPGSPSAAARLDQRLHRGVLAVQVRSGLLQASARLRPARVGVVLEVAINQGIRCAWRRRLTQAVDFQAHMLASNQPWNSRHSARAEDHFGIHVRPREAQRLYVKLVELTVTALEWGRSWRNIGPAVHKRSGPS